MDREVLRLRDMLSPRFAEIIYNGFWFSPEMDFIQAAFRQSETPHRRAGAGAALQGERDPERPGVLELLYDQDLSSMDVAGGYDQEDARGFIRINAGQTATVNFALGVSAVALDEIIVTGRRAARTGGPRPRPSPRYNAAAITEVAPVTNVATAPPGRTTGVSIRPPPARPVQASGSAFADPPPWSCPTSPSSSSTASGSTPGTRRSTAWGAGRKPPERHQPRRHRVHRDREGAGGRHALRRRRLGGRDPDPDEAGPAGRPSPRPSATSRGHPAELDPRRTSACAPPLTWPIPGGSSASAGGGDHRLRQPAHAVRRLPGGDRRNWPGRDGAGARTTGTSSPSAPTRRRGPSPTTTTTGTRPRELRLHPPGGPPVRGVHGARPGRTPTSPERQQHLRLPGWRAPGEPPLGGRARQRRVVQRQPPGGGHQRDREPEHDHPHVAGLHDELHAPAWFRHRLHAAWT
jgi:hypothetical protein